MDVEMPGGDGLTATPAILATCPPTRVLVLTMFDLDEHVFQALRAGACGFLLKTTPRRSSSTRSGHARQARRCSRRA
jgi:DNA-binding NarL/FixJ family response regulator